MRMPSPSFRKKHFFYVIFLIACIGLIVYITDSAMHAYYIWAAEAALIVLAIIWSKRKLVSIRRFMPSDFPRSKFNMFNIVKWYKHNNARRKLV